MLFRSKVLHITDTLGMGGAETWMLSLMRYWAGEQGPECHFLMTSGNGGIFDEELKNLGAKLYYSKYSRGSLKSFVRDFRTMLRNERYDVIHDHQGYYSGWHFLFGTGYLPPVRITHIHSLFPEISGGHNPCFSRRLTAVIGKYLVAVYSTVVAGTSWADRKSTRLNSSHVSESRMPSSA